MKTKITPEIHSKGVLNEYFIKMITNHNAGLVNVNPAMAIQRCRIYFAENADISPEFDVNASNERVDILEDNRPTISLIWKEIHELAETEEQANVLLQKFNS